MFWSPWHGMRGDVTERLLAELFGAEDGPWLLPKISERFWFMFPRLFCHILLSCWRGTPTKHNARYQDRAHRLSLERHAGFTGRSKNFRKQLFYELFSNTYQWKALNITYSVRFERVLGATDVDWSRRTRLVISDMLGRDDCYRSGKNCFDLTLA